MSEEEEEEWRPIVGWEGLYEVSSLGCVRSLARCQLRLWRGKLTAFRVRGKNLQAAEKRNGYLQVVLADQGRKAYYNVHVLVCEAFHGPRPHQHQVAHKDGVKTNNSFDNVRWDTGAGNYADRVSHGTDSRGERHWRAVLTNEIVRSIRSSEGTHLEISKRFGISRSMVGLIRNRKAWRHID